MKSHLIGLGVVVGLVAVLIAAPPTPFPTVDITPTKAQDPELPPPRRAPGEEDQVLPLIEFRDVTLDEALRLLSQQSGLKIVASAEAGKTRVSLFLQNVRPLVAVASVAQANNLIYRRDEESGIVRIFSAKEAQRDLSSFRDEQIKVFTLLYPNAFDAAQSIADLFGDRVQLNFGVDSGEMYDDIQNRLDRFDLIDGRSQGLGVFQNIGLGGGGGFGGGGFGGGGFGGGGIGGGGIGGGGFGNIGGGGGRGGVGGGGGALGGGRVNARSGLSRSGTSRDAGRIDTPLQDRATRLEGFTTEELQAIEDAAANREGADRTILFSLLRRRPATIYVTVVPRNNQVIVRTSDPQTMAQICDLVKSIDVPTPLLLLEVRVLRIELRDDFESVFDYQFADGLIAGGFTTGNILPPLADIGAPPPQRFQPINPQGTGIRSRDAYFQIVSAGFRARLQTLETKNRVTEVSSPILMTANNEVSRIFSGNTRPITIGFTPGQIVGTGLAATTSIAPTPITQLQDIGTTLLLTPSINADRTVSIRLLEETSTLGPQANIPIPVSGTSDGDSSSTSGVTQVPVDTVSRRTFSGTVVAKDGEAIAIGGLIEDRVMDFREQVPIISKVPYLGWFFRGQETTRSKSELVILVRPFVLSTACEAMPASRRLLEELSIHPGVVDGDLAPLGTYNPAEPIRPNPPLNELQKIFRTHLIVPKDF